MDLHEHVLNNYDMKLVGPKAVVDKFREDVAIGRAAERAAYQALGMVRFLRQSGRTITAEDLDTLIAVLDVDALADRSSDDRSKP